MAAPENSATVSGQATDPDRNLLFRAVNADLRGGSGRHVLSPSTRIYTHIQQPVAVWMGIYVAEPGSAGVYARHVLLLDTPANASSPAFPGFSQNASQVL